MATWESVENYIHSNYKVADQNGTFMELIFNMGDGRSQLTSVTNLGSFVFFQSPFATLDDASIERVFDTMEANGIALGIRGVGRRLFVIHSQLIETADAEEIDAGLFVVSDAADRLEDALGLGDRY